MQSLLRNSLFSLTLGLLFAAVGCGGGSSNNSGAGGSGGSGGGSGQNLASSSIYITYNSSLPEHSILQFPRTASGKTSPTATIKGSSTLDFVALAIDASGDIYVGAHKEGMMEILVYAPGASGAATPTRTISGADTDLQYLGGTATIESMDVDAAGNLYVGNADVVVGNNVYSAIVVFPPTASGNAAPTRAIGGPLTTISSPWQLALDSSNNLYVANNNPAAPDDILIFNSSAKGNVAPTNVIGGPKTIIGYVTGVAVDSAGNIYVANEQFGPTGGVTSPSILVFSAGSTGDVAPARTISGNTTTMLSQIQNIRVDGAGNIYVLSQAVSGAADGILKFAAGATGNVAPNATISSDGYLDFQQSIALQK